MLQRGCGSGVIDHGGADGVPLGYPHVNRQSLYCFTATHCERTPGIAGATEYVKFFLGFGGEGEGVGLFLARIDGRIPDDEVKEVWIPLV